MHPRAFSSYPHHPTETTNQQPPTQPDTDTGTMASPIASAVAGFFPSQTRRHNPELPALVRKEQQEGGGGPSGVLLPTDEEPHAREGAKAAVEGVAKRTYFPPGATRPTALQKAGRSLEGLMVLKVTSPRPNQTSKTIQTIHRST